MDKSQEMLSDIVIYSKYAKFLPSANRRETWEEVVIRYLTMMEKKYPKLKDEIWKKGEYLLEKKILMSMRAAQFAGPAIEKNEARIFNCAYTPVNHPYVFSEVMFLLLGGTGVGYSVQKHHVEELPSIVIPTREQKFLIGDSIEGWADSIKALMYSYFGLRKTRPKFDFSDIRPKGQRLVTAGGKAPGPEPLRRCLHNIEDILLRKKERDKLTSLEVHDICCFIADAVLAGGIRRAALISLFSKDDLDMITCKTGNWWELNPQRGRANNSAVLERDTTTKEEFDKIWKLVENSNAGEPGIYFTNDKDWGTNPCCEIALKPNQFCNLTEVSGADLEGQKDLDNRVEAAAFFGTLQAGFTDFHYLRKEWRETTEEEALIGVGITGICNGDILGLDLTQSAKIAKFTNFFTAQLIGINAAARVTTIKPSGSTSCVLGTSSGIHAWHDKYYIRNMQCGVGDDLYNYFVANHPQLIKIMDYDPKSAVIGIPQKAPDNAILRGHENAITMLERVKRFNLEWVKAGHRTGENTNNVSATVYIDSVGDYTFEGIVNEWPLVGEWMWANKDTFNGLSCLPFDGGSYKDAPFQTCTEAVFNEKYQYLDDIDLTKIIEEEDHTNLTGEIACGADGCEVK